MPAIINPKKYKEWLDTECKAIDDLEDILQNWTENELISRTVSKKVNNARINEVSNIEPLKQTEIDFKAVE